MGLRKSLAFEKREKYFRSCRWCEKGPAAHFCTGFRQARRRLRTGEETEVRLTYQCLYICQDSIFGSLLILAGSVLPFARRYLNFVSLLIGLVICCFRTLVRLAIGLVVCCCLSPVEWRYFRLYAAFLSLQARWCSRISSLWACLYARLYAQMLPSWARVYARPRARCSSLWFWYCTRLRAAISSLWIRRYSRSRAIFFSLRSWSPFFGGTQHFLSKEFVVQSLTLLREGFLLPSLRHPLGSALRPNPPGSDLSEANPKKERTLPGLPAVRKKTRCSILLRQARLLLRTEEGREIRLSCQCRLLAKDKGFCAVCPACLALLFLACRYLLFVGLAPLFARRYLSFVGLVVRPVVCFSFVLVRLEVCRVVGC